MSTKTLFVLTVSLLFLVGVALGYSIHTGPANQQLIPQSERERTFFDAWQRARLSTISPTVNFRVAANGAARDYVYGLSGVARAVSRGTDAATVSAVIDARSQGLAAAFNPVLSQQSQSTQAALWQNVGTATLEYAKTPSAANPTAKADAVKSMTAAIEQLTKYYSGLSERLPAPPIQASLNKAMIGLRQAIDESASNSLVKVSSSEQLAAQNLANLMDSITSVLVKQYASRF